MDLTKNPGRPLIVSFVLGAVATLSLNNWFQDWMGQDRYIEYLRGHWLTLPWEVDALILLWALWAFYRLGEKVFSKHADDAVASALGALKNPTPQSGPGKRHGGDHCD